MTLCILVFSKCRVNAHVCIPSSFLSKETSLWLCEWVCTVSLIDCSSTSYPLYHSLSSIWLLDHFPLFFFLVSFNLIGNQKACMHTWAFTRHFDKTKIHNVMFGGIATIDSAIEISFFFVCVCGFRYPLIESRRLTLCLIYHYEGFKRDFKHS